MLKDLLTLIKKKKLPTLGLMLLLLAIVICLQGCGSQAVVVPQQRQEVPQSLTQKESTNAEDYCKRVQNFLTRVADYTDGVQATTMR